jgi:hypothetical protein
MIADNVMAAYHEAGHAVAMWSLGHVVLEAKIIVGKEGAGGWAESVGEMTADEELLMLLAGPLAERRLIGSRGFVLSGLNLDRIEERACRSDATG